MASKLILMIAVLVVSGCGDLEQQKPDQNAAAIAEAELKRKAAADAEAADLLGLGNGVGNAQDSKQKDQLDDDGTMDAATLDLVTDM